MAYTGSIGRTPTSFRKHELLLNVIRGQCHAQAVRKPGPILLIDLTAGDGKGVPLPQPDLFLGILPSRSSPEILSTVSQEFTDTTLVFCERGKQRRVELAKLFPHAQILGDSKLAPTLITPRYRQGYALIVSDVNGMGHNLVAMQAIATTIPRSDFVLTLNERAFMRVLGGGPEWAEHAEPIVRYAWAAQTKRWMLDPQEWRQHLKKRQAAWTRQVIKASPNFHYRILVVAHGLSDVIRRHPNQWELFK